MISQGITGHTVSVSWLQIVILSPVLLFVGLLDENSMRWIALAIGVFGGTGLMLKFGGVKITRFRQLVAVALASAFTGSVVSISVTYYFAIENWQPVMSVSFVAGLFSYPSIPIAYRIWQRRAERQADRFLNLKLGKLDDETPDDA